MKIELSTDNWHNKFESTMTSIFVVIYFILLSNMVLSFFFKNWLILVTNILFLIMFRTIDKTYAKYVLEKNNNE